MKKLLLSSLALSVLSGCSSGVDEDNLKSVERALNIRHLCIKASTRSAPDNFVEALKTSLANKRISSEAMKNDGKDCEYILIANAKGNRQLIARAKFSVINAKTKSEVGVVGYKRRGDEKERAKQTGLQGQTDLMVNQLFKNY